MWWYTPYDPEEDYEEEEEFMSSLGSGAVEYTEGRSIIHFGSPEGTTYNPEPRTRDWRNVSVKDWLEEQHG